MCYPDPFHGSGSKTLLLREDKQKMVQSLGKRVVVEPLIIMIPINCLLSSEQMKKQLWPNQHFFAA